MPLAGFEEGNGDGKMERAREGKWTEGEGKEEVEEREKKVKR